jgi:hypothetical protein
MAAALYERKYPKAKNMTLVAYQVLYDEGGEMTGETETLVPVPSTPRTPK